VNHSTNADHLIGVTRNEIAARARFQWTPRGLYF